MDSHAEQQLAQDAAYMDKYSRQIGAYGLEAMSKLVKLKVLIIGLKGIGVETAKNLILAGPGFVTLYDDECVCARDLGSNFFLREEHVGYPRAASVVSQLQELNTMVTVRLLTGPLNEEDVGRHHVVVMTSGTRDEMTRWNAFCRSRVIGPHNQTIGFVACDSRGPSGYVFADYGPSFVVRDKTGENPVTRIITHISNAEEGVVTLLGAFEEEGGRMHGIQDDDHEGWVEISDVEGMEATDGKQPSSINECEAFRISTTTKKVIVEAVKNGQKQLIEKSVYDPYRLVIGDTTRFTPYLNGGVLTQVKKPVIISHRDLRSNLTQPIPPGEFMLPFTDGAKFGRAEQLFIAYLALWDFQLANGRYPNVRDAEEAEQVVSLARDINSRNKKLNEDVEEGAPSPAITVDEVDEDVVRKIAMHAGIELQPIACFFGGVVAQEIVKFTSKFTPLTQWLAMDWLEVLPDAPPTVEDATPQNSRYDDLILMFGAELVAKIQNSRTFMVGCGALGCEFLKNFALLGVGTGPQGLITVTDNDRIEVSNLSRQFLFREHNVGQPKSMAAAAAAIAMNPALRLDAKEALVAGHTEHIFPDEFWESLDFVTNALDNVKARLYVDSKCVFYSKPLLESGTLGTKCSVQVVVPRLTASYSDGPKDAEEDTIPMCTLRNFPSLIEHCIEWSRAQFADVFVKDFAEAKKFTQDPEGYIAQQRLAAATTSGRATAISEIRKLLSLLEATSHGPVSFEFCLHKAFLYFHEVFRDRILSLINLYNEDAVTSTGEKFWSGAKRFPQAANFNPDDALHVDLVRSVANILLCCYGTRPPPEQELMHPHHQYRDPSFIKTITRGFPVPEWINTAPNVDAEDDKKEEKEEVAMDVEAEEQEFATLVEQLVVLQSRVSDFNFEPAEFEKDQDLNFHIDFISSAANLRAWNYRIRGASRHKCKMIAGKIIPAVATTTASVTGLVMMEMLKLVQDKPLEAYKDSSSNLGLNMYMMQEPSPPEKAKDEYDHIMMVETKCYPEGFTKWDKIVIDQGRRLTMREFIEAVHATTSLTVTVLYHSVAELDGPQKGKLLYQSWAFQKELKQLYDLKLDADLLEWLVERYAGSPTEVIGPNKRYVQLLVSCSDAEGSEYKTPAVVYKWIG